MVDTENQEVLIEGQNEVINSNEESQETINAAPQTEETVLQESSEAKNFKALRESKERVERERDEAVRRLQDIEYQNSQEAHYEEPVEQEESSIAPDDLVEGKHLSKVEKKIKKLEQQVQEYQQNSTVMSAEAKLKAQYPDFDNVVSRDNLKMLQEAYPELYHTLNSSTDLYSTAVSTYTIIKKMGIHKEDLYKSDKDLAHKNASKPKPLASVSPQQGDSPLSRANAFANGLTEELKTQLRKEMAEARKKH